MSVGGGAVFKAHCKVGNDISMGGGLVVEEGGQIGDGVTGGGGIRVGKYGCIPVHLIMGGGVHVPAYGSVTVDDWGRVKILSEVAGKMYVLQPNGECVLSPRYNLFNLH